MYYVLRQAQGMSSKYAYFKKEPDEYDIDEFYSDVPIKPIPPTIKLFADPDAQTQVSDLLPTQFDLYVASPKLMNLFNKMKIEGLSYYPADVLGADGNALAEGYHIMHIMTRCACLDTANSKLRYSASKRKALLSVEDFSIIEEKIQPLPGSDKKPLMFRLDEFERLVLAHDSIKTECESQGITGIRFVKTEEYFF